MKRQNRRFQSFCKAGGGKISCIHHFVCRSLAVLLGMHMGTKSKRVPSTWTLPVGSRKELVESKQPNIVRTGATLKLLLASGL